MSAPKDAPKPTVARVTVHLVDGSSGEQPVAAGQRLLDRILKPGGAEDHLSGRDLIHNHFGDDLGPGPLLVEMEVRASSGTRPVVIPYNDTKVPVIRKKAKLGSG